MDASGMHDLLRSLVHATLRSTIGRSRFSRRVLATGLIALALLVSGAGTALAVHQLADADGDVEGY
jgi:hypothetical protein